MAKCGVLIGWICPGVAVWKEGNSVRSESYVPSLPHLTDDPICKPNVIVHTFTFHANLQNGEC